MPELSVLDWVFVCTVVALGATIQGSVGFGMNVLAAPLVVQVEPRLVPVPLLVAALVITVAVALRDRAHLVVGDLGWAVGGRIPGAVAGTVAVAMLSRDALALTLAGAVLLAVAVSVTGMQVPVTRTTLAGAGVASGFMGTATSVGGPPMALLYQHGAGDHVRANLSTFFAIGVVLSLAVLGLAGEIGPEEGWLALAVVPAVLVGFLASRWTRGHIDAGRVRPAVLGLSGLSALGLLIRTLL